jgi:predicted nuclease with TOPRIM domain
MAEPPRRRTDVIAGLRSAGVTSYKDMKRLTDAICAEVNVLQQEGHELCEDLQRRLADGHTGDDDKRRAHVALANLREGVRALCAGTDYFDIAWAALSGSEA